jgi:alanine racemase
MVRPGIALYGCKPNPAREIPLNLKPVLCLKGSVVKIKQVPAGTPISYGGTYVTKTDTTLATINIGYGQGLPRQLGNRGTVLIQGRRYTIAGRVTMDFIMVDAGPVPAFTTGDEAVAIGYQDNEIITPDDIALLCNTIGYEILCSISSRIDRSYILDGRIIHHEPSLPF